MKLLLMALLIGLGMVLLATTMQGQEVILGKVCLETKLSKAMKCNRLKSYVEQTTPVAAIMFTTKKNKVICVNPEQSWVKQAVQCLKTKKSKGPNPKKKKSKKKNRKAKSKSTP
ncbi:eotaxin [Xenopus laevis]|uniref:Chemokine interleukin-8-like domain-containing protein n=2 Tax=Xenopus laevis TaxID=8355 RepID=A0A974CWI5_XENLA|nr:eotaxin [Xenopus laevis]OCT81173.1 hypothetical protein XELAEV_18027986mg [Xenopus laevis]